MVFENIFFELFDGAEIENAWSSLKNRSKN